MLIVIPDCGQQSGSTVAVKGTSTAIGINVAGQNSITSTPNTVFTISPVGFAVQEFSGGRTIVDMVLFADSRSLSEAMGNGINYIQTSDSLGICGNKYKIR